MRIVFPTMVLVSLVGCGETALTGSLKDDAGAPLADVTLSLKATGEVGLTCQMFGGKTDAEGNFSIDGVCLSQSDYTVTLSDDSLWLADKSSVTTGHTGPLSLVAIRHGGGPGVYHQKSPTEVGTIKTGGDIKSSEQAGTKFSYVADIKNVLVLPAGEKLVINGADNISGYKWHSMTYAPGPLTHGVEGSQMEVIEGGGIWAIGGTLAAEAFTAGSAAAPDAGKMSKKESGDVSVAWISGDALPAGRYAFFKDGDRRAHVIDMGSAWVKPEAPPAE